MPNPARRAPAPDRAHEQALHDIAQARLGGARALNLSPRRFVTADGAVHPGNAIYRHLGALPPELAALEGLERLDLTGTQVAGLGPVAALGRLGRLDFRGIPAATGELGRIALIEDDAARTAAALAFLRRGEPVLPDPAPAPVAARFEGERLVAAPPGPPRLVGAEAEARARRAWEAMRAYHGEIAALLAGRNMPSLDRALAAFGAALGESYGALNVLALGTQARRVARIAAEAREMLLDDAAADLAEFAAAATLYMGRFEDWRAYLDEAGSRPADPPALAEAARPAARDLIRALSLEAWVEADLPAQLGAAEAALDDAGADPVVQRGLTLSLAGLLAVLGRRAVEGLRGLARQAGRTAADIAAELRRTAAKSAAAALTAAVVAFLAAQSGTLTALADRLPASLGWLADLVRYLAGA